MSRATPQYEHAHEHVHGDGAQRHHAPEVGTGNERRVFWAMLLTGSFMVVEVIGGIVSGSLALIADAGHMAMDVASLALAWTAFRLARRPPDQARSYGFHRAEILAAFVNALVMIALAVWIVVEAVSRLMDPVEILGGVMLWVAVGGLAVNIAAFALLHGGDRENLNIRGAVLHVAGDLLGSVAAILAAAVILTTGWTAADPLLSMIVAVLLLRSAGIIARDAGHILMEGTPPGLKIDDVRADLIAHIDGIEDVHHIHAWSLTPAKNVMTLHARIAPDTDQSVVLDRINERLSRRFAVGHATVQIERDTCPDHPTS